MPSDIRARIAIDLGAESCRVSLLRWIDELPTIKLIHRFPNGPIHHGRSLRWPLGSILDGLEAGLRNAAEAAPEGIASVAVDGWAVDYVRLSPDGRPLADPFCYRDERTVQSKEEVDKLFGAEYLFRHTGAQPLRINTLYQLYSDVASRMDPMGPWLCLPEYILHWLGGRRVAEYTNATHTGLVNLETGDWSTDLFVQLGIPTETAPPIVPPGTVVGTLTGPLAQLPAYRSTDLIAPACHDTASAIAGIPKSLNKAAYISSGTWSLVGTVVDRPIAMPAALNAGFTNQGSAGSGFCFHTNVNGMWLLRRCIESWRSNGRDPELSELILKCESCTEIPGVIPVDAASLMMDDNMPARLNEQLRFSGFPEIEDRDGNEHLFARLIFKSLASRYATVLQDLEALSGIKLERIHVLGGGSLNRTLTEMTADCTGLFIEIGNSESSTIGNFAVQLATSLGDSKHPTKDSIERWAKLLSECSACTAGRGRVVDIP